MSACVACGALTVSEATQNALHDARRPDDLKTDCSEREYASDGNDRLLNIWPNRMRAESAGQDQDER